MVLPRFASLSSVATLALVGSGLIGACSSSNPAAPTPQPGDGGAGDGGACQAFVPPSTFNATSPTYAFTKDVLPILATSCALSSCHGSVGAPAGGMFLGSDPARVYGNLVGVASTEYPSMVRIKAGDPANSFLLYRVDDDACTLSGCTSQACAELMPQGGPQLGETSLLTLRAWIAQGAVSDVPDAGSTADADTDAATDASGD